jgi:hypothetical protein
MTIHRTRSRISPPTSLDPNVAASPSKPAGRRRQPAAVDQAVPAARQPKLDASPTGSTRRNLAAGGKRLATRPGPTDEVTQHLQRLEQSGRKVRSDELADVLIGLNTLIERGTIREVPQALRNAIRQIAERSMDQVSSEAAGFAGATDFKALWAEELGQLYLIAYGCLEDHRHPPVELTERAEKARQLMETVAGERVSELRALAQRAATSAPAESIREAEQVAVSLDVDNARLYRYGFDKLPIDPEALVTDVKAAAVRYFQR